MQMNTPFKAHAIENHPMSYVLFGDQNIQQNNIPNVPNIPNTTISDSNIPLIKSEPNDGTILFYCCPECDYKSEDVSMFQIHALERHPDSMTFFSRYVTTHSRLEWI